MDLKTDGGVGTVRVMDGLDMSKPDSEVWIYDGDSVVDIYP